MNQQSTSNVNVGKESREPKAVEKGSNFDESNFEYGSDQFELLECLTLITQLSMIIICSWLKLLPPL